MPPSARFLPLLAGLLLPALPSLAADPAPAPLLHRSSLAAVLAQRGALQLTPDQVKLLEQADAKLARDQETARAARARTEEVPPGSPPSRSPGGSGVGPASGGPGGGGMSGGKVRPAPPRSAAPSPTDQLQQELDALDTEAFLKALEGLPEPQREKVTEVASRHRELVFEQREREKSR